MKFRMLLITVALVAFASLSYGQGWNASFNSADGVTGEYFFLTKNCEPVVWEGEEYASAIMNGFPDGLTVEIWNDINPEGPGPEDIRPVDLDFINFQTGGAGLDGLLASPYCYAGGRVLIANPKFYLKCRYVEVLPTVAHITDYVSASVTALNNTGNTQDLAFTVWTCTTRDSLLTVPCEPHTDLVTLVPNTFPFPSQQNNVKACAKVGDGVTHIVVPVVNNTNQPHISVQQGCFDCGDITCDPLNAIQLTVWSYGPLVPPVVLSNGDVCRYAFSIDLSKGVNGTGCCACITLDEIEPVEMTSFDAVASDNSVTLNWSVASQTGITSWSVLRNDAKIADVNADVYTYTDTRANNGTTYSYKVVGMNANGASISSSVVEATPMANLAVITKYDVSQNYPNPFNPSTTISFDVLKDNNVSLKVFNAMGQEVTTLANGTYMGGKRYTVTFDAKNLTSGLYFYTVKIGNEFSATKKMLLVK